MTHEQALKRIEEEHSQTGGHGEGCFNEFGEPYDPCDVVKLARALCYLLEAVDAGAPGVASVQAEDVLSEVAGGGDE